MFCFNDGLKLFANTVQHENCFVANCDLFGEKMVNLSFPVVH